MRWPLAAPAPLCAPSCLPVDPTQMQWHFLPYNRQMLVNIVVAQQKTDASLIRVASKSAAAGRQAGSGVCTPHTAVAAIAATGAAAAAVGAGDIRGAQLHTGLLAENVELRNEAASRGLHDLAFEVAEVAASHRHLQGRRGGIGEAAEGGMPGSAGQMQWECSTTGTLQFNRLKGILTGVAGRQAGALRQHTEGAAAAEHPVGSSTMRARRRRWRL